MTDWANPNETYSLGRSHGRKLALAECAQRSCTCVIGDERDAVQVAYDQGREEAIKQIVDWLRDDGRSAIGSDYAEAIEAGAFLIRSKV